MQPILYLLHIIQKLNKDLNYTLAILDNRLFELPTKGSSK